VGKDETRGRTRPLEDLVVRERTDEKKKKKRSIRAGCLVVIRDTLRVGFSLAAFPRRTHGNEMCNVQEGGGGGGSRGERAEGDKANYRAWM